MKQKIFRLSWVLLMLVAAFMLGRFLQPKSAAMSSALRRPPALNFARMKRPGPVPPSRTMPQRRLPSRSR